MQVEIDIVDSKDDNFVNIFSFNNEIKDYEATESLVFLKLVQNALLSYARQHRVKRIKGIWKFCHNIKTAKEA